MVKTKSRLLFIGISIILIPILLYILKSYLNSSIVRNMNREEFIHNVHLRKLNQPFEWHSQGPGEEVEADKLEKFNNSTGDEIKKITTCRNSVQGKLWIADDQGFICHRSDISSNGCCDRNSTSSLKYSCNGCTNSTGCCETFEFCVSCCMNPVNKEELMSVLNEASALSNLLLLSVSDQFELCLAKCRTSSRSVQHENLYIDSKMKYCYSKGPVLTTPSNNQP
eukprot:10805.XXX_474508_475384_1 [CDS] Oithona nana genome sequencing.